jgi:hypothetical protein
VVEQPGVPVLLRPPPEGQLVRVASAFQIRQQLVERLGVPDLVLGQRRDGHVLLEDRGDPGPLRVPEADDELVIGGRQ